MMAQTLPKEVQEQLQKNMLKNVSDDVCKCVDSISTYNKSTAEVASEINACIKKHVTTYQLASQLVEIDTTAQKKKNITINISEDENSADFKKYYYEIERFVMDSCKAVRSRISRDEKQREKSYSNNKDAQDYYSKGVGEEGKENFQQAIEYYKKAVAIDPEFAFAWDNLGLNYRRLNDYDNAIAAYKKSLEIDPLGEMPLQNIAVAYTYKKDYPEAIKAYEKLAEVNKDNAEVYYGLGRLYTFNLKDYEKGLDNMCKAYNLYIAQKSPYRTDAEKNIQAIYTELKAQKQEDKFYEILKANNISTK
jgi:tetratricopeptide (TPR) repeat protein